MIVPVIALVVAVCVLAEARFSVGYGKGLRDGYRRATRDCMARLDEMEREREDAGYYSEVEVTP